ncbi:MAG: PQQ-binding-like beta-propeller repeat protein [Planctomycetota bacterium]
MCFWLSLFAPDAWADTWDQWRGPNRDGTVSNANWPDDLSKTLKLRWSVPLSPSYSGPVVSDGLVFTTETIDKKTERVTAFDLSTGKSAWQTSWGGYMSVPFFAAANGDWIRSTPACVDNALVVLGMRDHLVCLDPKTGDQRWEIDFPDQFDQPLQAFGAVCSPLIDGDAVYVQLGGGLTKVDLETGDVQWQVLSATGGMSGGAFSSPSLATINGQRQLLVQTRLELCGVDLETGDVYWKEPIEAFRGMNILTPMAIGDSVFTAAHSGRSQLFSIQQDAEQDWTANEIWQQKTQGYMSSPIRIDDSIYLHLKNERFACLSVTDGSIRWTSPPVGKYWSMVAAGDKILALANDGTLRLIRANPETFDVIDEMKVADDSWAYLAVENSQVIIRSLDALKVFAWDTTL